MADLSPAADGILRADEVRQDIIDIAVELEGANG